MASDRTTAHKAQGAGAEKVETSGSKVDRHNTTKKMMKPIGIERAVKSNRRGIDRSMEVLIEAQDGGGAVHKKCNGDTVQKKHDGLRSSGRRIREKRWHHNDFYDL